jgi:hypothetical protein
MQLDPMIIWELAQLLTLLNVPTTFNITCKKTMYEIKYSLHPKRSLS